MLVIAFLRDVDSLSIPFSLLIMPKNILSETLVMVGQCPGISSQYGTVSPPGFEGG